MKLKLVYKGGEGSGHRGHTGRPGKVGGSSPDKGGSIVGSISYSTGNYGMYKDDWDVKKGVRGSKIRFTPEPTFALAQDTYGRKIPVGAMEYIGNK